jgi:hypothetical protein
LRTPPYTTLESRSDVEGRSAQRCVQNASDANNQKATQNKMDDQIIAVPGVDERGA